MLGLSAVKRKRNGIPGENRKLVELRTGISIRREGEKGGRGRGRGDFLGHLSSARWRRRAVKFARQSANARK